MRIKSEVAVRFRQWAIRHLHEFMVKGFTLDDDRLKGNRSRYFRELLQRLDTDSKKDAFALGYGVLHRAWEIFSPDIEEFKA